jgi:hypothetical protein
MIMAVRTNLGQITSAIQQGKQAYDNINFNPSIPQSISAKEDIIGDWGAQEVDTNIFIMGIHKWADTTLKVTK